MEVAIKKFMWDTEDRRYDDFLPEDSIINRLRHKNIVSLVSEYQVTLYSLPPLILFPL